MNHSGDTNKMVGEDHFPDAKEMVSDTPRTDAAYFKPGATMYDLAGEMKRVERQLAAAKARIKRLEEAALMALHGCYNGPMPDHVRDALADAMEAKL